jgi:hypothetical protein
MNLSTLICPQCGAPLPRRALWRAVVCTYCAAEVTHCSDIVRAATFTEAYQRSLNASDTGGRTIACGGERYRVLRQLGHGASAQVMLAQRLGALAERVVVKLAHPGTAPGRMQREAEVLQQLQRAPHAGSAYFSQRLPQAISHGIAEEDGGRRCEALVLRHPTGYWGSLADVKRNYPDGIPAPHAVWMWRRILEVIGYVHELGWTHGRLAPEHLLVHPDDHGVLLIGWADVRQAAPRKMQARDLMQSTWTIRAMLHGGDGEPPVSATTPAPLAALLKRASEDADWCAHMGAAGIEQALKTAAAAAFGPPRFIPFTPHQKE